MIRLVRPCQTHRASYIEALLEHAAVSTNPENIYEEIDAVDLFISRQQSAEAGYEAFWLIGNSDYLGTIQLRRTPEISQLYYDVRPSARGMGYGRTLLELAKRVAKNRGLWPLLLQADRDNKRSIYLIKSCGGIDVTQHAAADVRQFRFD